MESHRKTKLMTHLFENQTIQNNNRSAVSDQDLAVTYGQLNTITNRIANRILLETSHAPIALLMDQSVMMVAAIMAVFKTGRTIVPLSSALPVGRIDYILRNTNVDLLITDVSNRITADVLKEKNMNLTVFDAVNMQQQQNAGNLETEIDPEKDAIILYTSGSTGVPKGIRQSYRSLTFFIKAFAESMQLKESDRLSLTTSCSHAVGIIDIISSLISGVHLMIYDIRKKEALNRLPVFLHDKAITIFHSVPSVFRHIAAMLEGYAPLPLLRSVILGGETVFKKDFETFRKYFNRDCRFVNFYGLSEVMTVSFNILTGNSVVYDEIISVGKVVDGIKVLILNENGDPVKNGYEGEIVYDSQYLFSGYWNEPELTDRVLSGSDIDKDRYIFKSGDLGRFTGEGILQHLGRIDLQIKIRGNRLELLEIEAVLDNHEKISKSVVKAFRHNETDIQLVAYYSTVLHCTVTEKEIVDYLKQKLPDFMMPGLFIPVDKFEYSNNGKLIRNSLPEPDRNLLNASQGEKPGTETQIRIAQIWQDLLNVEYVGISDNFIKLGGHSLQALSLVKEITGIFGIDFSLQEIFNTQTLLKMSEAVDQKVKIKIRNEQKIMSILDEIESNG